MKLAFFDDYKLGVIKGDRIVDVSEAVKGVVHTSPQDLIRQVIGDFPKHRRAIESAAEKSQGVAVSGVRLRAPLPEPPRIVAMAVNYMENGTREKAAEINAFHKSASCVIGNGDTVILPDADATIFEQEAELGIVIGKKASKVERSKAQEYIFGYTNFFDISARGFRPEGSGSFFWGKTWDTFGPMGPAITTSDEIKNPMKLQVKSWINGKLYQDYSTSDMANDIPRIVEWVSWITTLYPGDIIACGTNHRGLAAIQNGDVVEMEAEGLGRLMVRVKDELGREWDRKPRLEKSAEEIKKINGPARLERLGKRR
jgi:2-keto-4-pentenoate hydratase/2-oxohepta-3-ene-1,7-dioic acid hydratase in catechol pathway